MTSQVSLPQYAAPAGQTAKDEEQMLREQYPSILKGVAAEIPGELKAAYDQAKLALDYWETQKKLIANQVRRHLGQAEIATFQGEPLFKRRKYPVAEFVMKAHDVDGIYPANTKSPN